MQRLAICALSAFFSVFAGLSIAQEFPTKTIRIVVPYPPGGQMDQNARLIGTKVSSALGKAVIVENKPGAQSMIGAQDVARSAPDGHTVMFTNGATNTVVPHLYMAVPFDPVADFTPISLIARTGSVLIAPANAPYSTVREMIAYAKAHPGVLNFGSISASSQLQGEILKDVAGIDIVHVPYKGSSDSLAALLAGNIHLLWDSAFSASSLLKAKRVKPLAVNGTTRLPQLPDIPTAQEAGIQGLESLGWIGFLGPKGMSPAITRRLSDEFARAIQAPEIRQVFLNAANEPVGSTPEEFAAIVARDYAMWGAAVKKAGIQKQ